MERSTTLSSTKSLKTKIVNNFQKVGGITKTQRQAIQKWEEGYHLILDGSAGTGKSYLSVALAFNEVLDKKKGRDKVVIIRSAVPSRDIGFMPGNHREKTELYATPYKAIVADLFKDKQAWDYHINSGSLVFDSTSFIRGITFENSIIIADEMQNMNFEELNTIMTRIGNNSRVIFAGDYYQSDLRRTDEKKGILDFLDILTRMKSFAHIQFNHNDIVRSGIVKEYIIAKENLPSFMVK